MKTLTPTWRALSAAALAGLMLTATACASPRQSTAASEIPSATPSATAVTSTSAARPGLPVKGKVNDGKGQYLQTTIAEDDQALKYNPAIVEASASDLFSEDEITAAQKFVGTFIAEEFIDSTLNNNWPNPAAVDEWWPQHSDIVLPMVQQETLDRLKNGQTSVMLLARGTQREGNYEVAYNADSPRITSRSITPTKIQGGTSQGYTLLGLNYDVTWTMNAQIKTGPVPETNHATCLFTLTKVNGVWKIAGYNNTISTNPVG